MDERLHAVDLGFVLGRDFAVFAEESQPSFTFFLQFFFRALALQGFGLAREEWENTSFK